MKLDRNNPRRLALDRHRTPPNTRISILARVARGEEDECWLWTGHTTRFGHGQARLEGKATLVHRLAWEYHHGPIPDRVFVCHRCDVPSCCNPNHLFLGTPADNMSDMVSKQRHNPCLGTKHGMVKLTEEQVVFIMARLLVGGQTKTAIGKDFGVSHSSISEIWSGKRWAHLFIEPLVRREKMLGTLRYDEKGMIIEVSDTLSTEPVLITRAYRVTEINSWFPPEDGAGVHYQNGAFHGSGFSCGTAELPERTTETPLLPPRKNSVWKNGEWKAR